MDKFIFSILLILLVSCSSTSPANRALDTAETIMDQHPDSALSILNRIDPSELVSDKSRALYSLLITQALDKNYIDVNSDSTINTAVSYFEKSSDKRHLMLSLYYQSTIHYNCKDFSESLITLFRCYDLANELDDKFWIAVSARKISDIYHENHCVTEESEFAKIALNNFRLAGNPSFINYALHDVARAYHCNGDYNMAITITDEVLDSAKVHNDTSLKMKALELRGLSYFSLDKYDKAYDCFQSLYTSPCASTSDSAYYGIMSFYTGKTRQAIDIVNQLNSSPQLSTPLRHFLNYLFYTVTDSTHKALEMMKGISSDSDSALRDVCHQNLLGSVMEYHQYKSAVNQANLKASRAQTVTIIVITTLIIAILISVGRKRIMRQKALIDEYISMSYEMKKLIEEHPKPSPSQDEIAELPLTSKAIEQTDAQSDNRSHPSLKLLEAHFKELNLLCKNFNRENTPDARKKVNDCVTRIIDSIAADTQRIKELENYANYRHDNIMVKLRSDFPKLNEDYYLTFLFSCLGFSVPTISLLLKKENQKTTVYNYRKRLKQKFREFNGENKDSYLEAMS